MASKFNNPLHLLNSLRKAPIQTFQDATFPEVIGLSVGGSAAVGLGAYGLGNLLGYGSNPAPVSNNGQQMAPAPARPVAQQNAGTGISNPQPQPSNFQALLSNVQPMNIEDATKLEEYTQRNINRDLVLLAQLQQLQNQLEGGQQ